MKTSIERISRNDGGSEKTRNTRRNGPGQPRRRSVFFPRRYFSRGSPRGRLPFRLFLQPPPLSLSLRGKREGWSSFDRGIDSSSNLKKKRGRERKEEGLRRRGRGGKEFNTDEMMVGLFMKMAFFIGVRWVSTPLLLALERARWRLAISN